MKLSSLVFLPVQLIAVLFVSAQKQEIVFDLTKVNDPKVWSVYNRTVTNKNGEVYLDAKEGDGVLLFKGVTFDNGRIELDIKGRDEQGRSFVGIVFHGLNETTFDGIYFRPFNFKNPERKGHSVQYISHPEYTWSKLREQFPEKYEDPVNPVPDPNDWFHATIVVEYPVVNVFVNNSTTPSLTVTQLSTRKTGQLGLWVGNNSEGYFRNLKVIKK